MQTNSLLRKGFAVGIILLFIGTCIIPSNAQDTEKQSSTSRGSWLYVGGSGPGNYKSIQSAINDADPDDILNNSIFSEYIYWQWARGAGGIINDHGWDVAVDADGNAYFTGDFADVAAFGPTALTSQGDYDVFVAKLNKDGTWQWATSAGGTDFDWGRGIAVDIEGNTYVTGHFTGNATFGTTTLTGQGYFNVFVAKLNANGVWLWAVSGGGSDADEGWDIGLDANENPYITGHFLGTVTFGDTNLTCEGGDDVFVAKLNTAGAWQWATDSGGTSPDRGQGIAVEPDGDSYITGYFEGLVTFGNSSMSSQGYRDVFVAKLNPEGIWQWARSGGGTGKDQGYSIAVDENTSLSIIGEFDEGTAIFGNTSLTSRGRTDVFVANLNTYGTWQWVTSGGGSNYDDGYGIALDAYGNTYITGAYQSWIQFGNTTLTSQAGEELYCAKLDKDGAWQWATSACGAYQDVDWGYSIAVEANGTAYITGTFHGSVTFGDITIFSHGMFDALIAKVYEIFESLEPPIINGPTNGTVNHTYTFSAQLPTDPEGDEMFLKWDWADGTVTEWLGPYPSGQIVFASYTWTYPRVYAIRAKLKETNGVQSEWSDPHMITIVNNKPPMIPTITGSAKGKPGVTYMYSFETIDPETDDVLYYIDWGDNTNTGWLGEYPSGVQKTASHSWNSKGTYIIKIKAMDIWGAESDWGTLQVTMPYSYEKPVMHFLELLFERFPHAFPILRHLLGFNR